MKKIMAALFAGLMAFQLSASDSSWLTDLDKAKEQAKKENKLVLIDFTGSDWCGWCIKLDKETFSKSEFKDYAKKNVVLVELDFPRKKEQPEELKKANQALKSKFGVKGFPTLVILNSDGKEVWKQPGYLAGGPKAMIEKLEEAKKK